MVKKVRTTQRQKERVRRVQELRRSSASGPQKIKVSEPQIVDFDLDEEDFDLFDWLKNNEENYAD